MTTKITGWYIVVVINKEIYLDLIHKKPVFFIYEFLTWTRVWTMEEALFINLFVGENFQLKLIGIL